MSLTSDERRNVAKELRDLIDDDLSRDDPRSNVPLDDVERVIGLYGGFYEGGTTADCVEQLADLIDPRCEDMAAHREDAFAPGKKACDGHFICSRCHFDGRVFGSIGFGDMATSETYYCPNCGARVVRPNGE